MFSHEEHEEHEARHTGECKGRSMAAAGGRGVGALRTPASNGSS
jgi:hypothetical protein